MTRFTRPFVATLFFFVLAATLTTSARQSGSPLATLVPAQLEGHLGRALTNGVLPTEASGVLAHLGLEPVSDAQHKGPRE